MSPEKFNKLALWRQSKLKKKTFLLMTLFMTNHQWRWGHFLQRISSPGQLRLIISGGSREVEHRWGWLILSSLVLTAQDQPSQDSSTHRVDVCVLF